MDDSIDNILTLIDSGEIDLAIDAVDRAFDEYGSEAPYLVYAQHEIRQLAWRYKESGAWKNHCPAYADSLLHASHKSDTASQEISLALKHFGHLLRFLYRDRQAIPILEALMHRECNNPQLWQLGYGPEGTWGLLAECYKDTGSPDTSASIRQRVSEQNDLYRAYWEKSEVSLRDVSRELSNEANEAVRSGLLRLMDVDEVPLEDSANPWWKFW